MPWSTCHETYGARPRIAVLSVLELPNIRTTSATNAESFLAASSPPSSQAAAGGGRAAADSSDFGTDAENDLMKNAEGPPFASKCGARQRVMWSGARAAWFAAKSGRLSARSSNRLICGTQPAQAAHVRLFSASRHRRRRRRRRRTLTHHTFGKKLSQSKRRTFSVCDGDLLTRWVPTCGPHASRLHAPHTPQVALAGVLSFTRSRIGAFI